MEEDKAAAYYDELSRKGEGAARFKQGLGFTSSDDVPARGSSIPSSSSFLGQFIRASSPSSTAKLEKDSEIRSIRDKLKRKPDDHRQSRVQERSDRRRSRSRERDDRDRRHRRRSRSRSRSRERRRKSDRDDRERRKRRSRSSSPRRERRRSDDERKGNRRGEGNGKIDYSKLIRGYDEMSAAEKVKAKMKLQLVETSGKDTSMGSGWERFEFDKDAPMDDEEIEVADDDAALVKRMGQSFRFSAIEAKREDEIKAAHDKAMFGAPSHLSPTRTGDITDTASVAGGCSPSNTGASHGATSLLSEKVLARQQGSWRDRARRLSEGKSKGTDG